MEVLLVIQVITVVALIAVILVQKSSSDGFTGSGSANSFLTGRASANLFTRITAILATIFIANSLVLAYIASHSERASSILDKAVEESAQENKDKPATKTKGSLSDLENKMKDMNPNAKPSGKTAAPAESKLSEEKPAEKKPAEQKPSAPASPTVPVSE